MAETTKKTTKRHKWTFPARFRANAFGWRASNLACRRIKEAVAEIKKAAKSDPVLGAEGVVLLAGKLWPALQHVDTSTGALGSAVNRALQELLPILIDAPAERKTRDKWLERLWDAVMDDGVSYLSPLGERWGDICGSKETASAWVDEMLFMARDVLTSPSGGIFNGTAACLSSLVTAQRYRELFDLLEASRYKFWHNRKFGALALAKMGKKAEAIQYAEACRDPNYPTREIDRFCEEVLISSGLYEEAYRRYGLYAHTGTTYLARFRATARRYPMIDKTKILKDLIDSTGEEGKWFATAKELGLYDLAVELAFRSPCDPRTLNRAARDFQVKNPKFALGAAMASLKWMSEGWGYEITTLDVRTAFDLAVRIADSLGVLNDVKDDVKKIIDNALSSGKFVRDVLTRDLEHEKS